MNFLSAPTFVWWDITNKCNFSCLHCYSNSNQSNEGKDLSTEEAQNLIQELSEIGVFYIYFLGGEPFLRKDFLDLLLYTRKFELQVAINSNGWFVTDAISKYLKEIDVKCVRISIDGSDFNTHELLRRKKNSFSRGINAINKLLEANIERVGIVSTITKHNINDVGDIIDLASHMKVDHIQIVPLNRSGRGCEIYDKFSLSPKDFMQLRHTLQEKQLLYKETLFIQAVDNLISSKCASCVSENGTKPDYMGCRAGRIACNINHNGDVIPCIMVRKPVAGNIRTLSFKEIWNNSKVFYDWRHAHLNSPECSACKYKEVCLRECPNSASQCRITGLMRKKTLAKMKERSINCSLKSCPNIKKLNSTHYF